MRKFLSISFLVTVIPAVVCAKPTRFEVKDVAYRNVVSFVSDAPLEKTIGVSHYVTGWIEVDPQNVKAGVKAELEVDVRAFQLGPESRQTKLRETLFLANEYPGASFKIDRLIESSADVLAPGKTVTGKVSGSFAARGVTRRQEAFVKVTYHTESETTKKRLSGNLLKVSADFILALHEFKFPVPDALSGLLAPP